MRHKRAELARGSDAVRHARASLQQKIEVKIRELPRSEEAARTWSTIAWCELAAGAAMAQMNLALLRSGADLDTQAAAAQMGADELRHAELARDVAAACGGYQAAIPDGFPLDPDHFGDAMELALPFWVVAHACVAECASLALWRARLAHTAEPTIYAVITAMIKDESAHQEIGWHIAERALRELPTVMVTDLSEHALAAIEKMGAVLATHGLPRELREQARHDRTITAQLGLGACMPDVEDEVVQKAIDEVVRPRLTRLGLKL